MIKIFKSLEKILKFFPLSGGERESVSLNSFLGAQHELKGPLVFSGPEVPDLTPLARQDPACCHFHFFFCALQAPQAWSFNALLSLILPCINWEDWKRGKQSLGMETLKWQCYSMGTWCRMSWRSRFLHTGVIHIMPSLRIQAAPYPARVNTEPVPEKPNLSQRCFQRRCSSMRHVSINCATGPRFPKWELTAAWLPQSPFLSFSFRTTHLSFAEKKGLSATAGHPCPDPVSNIKEHWNVLHPPRDEVFPQAGRNSGTWNYII